MNWKHLREEHELINDLLELIDRYQQKRNRYNTLYKMKGHLLKISTIAQIINNRDEILRKGKRPRQNQ
jgi:hypothetical protein